MLWIKILLFYFENIDLRTQAIYVDQKQTRNGKENPHILECSASGVQVVILNNKNRLNQWLSTNIFVDNCNL